MGQGVRECTGLAVAARHAPVVGSPRGVTPRFPLRPQSLPAPPARFLTDLHEFPGPCPSACAPPAWALGLLAYVAAWTVLPALLAPSMPFDVVEGIAWGHEWQWGYYKHPPLPAWLLYPAYVGLGKFGPYLGGQLSIVLALVYVYRLARELLGPERAGLAAALLYGVAYYTWPTLSFNHNIAQIPVWAALAWHAHAAMQRNRTRDWVWLGVWAGLGLLTKYSSAVMLACLAAYLVLGPQRRLLRQRGPWLALVVAPHALWLWQHDGMPFTYLAERSQRLHGRWAQRAGLRFLLAQAVMHLPLLALLLACGAWPRGRRLYLREHDRHITRLEAKWNTAMQLSSLRRLPPSDAP